MVIVASHCPRGFWENLGQMDGQTHGGVYRVAPQLKMLRVISEDVESRIQYFLGVIKKS